jgi:hypothetical protein
VLVTAVVEFLGGIKSLRIPMTHQSSLTRGVSRSLKVDWRIRPYFYISVVGMLRTKD